MSRDEKSMLKDLHSERDSFFAGREGQFFPGCRVIWYDGIREYDAEVVYKIDRDKRRIRFIGGGATRDVYVNELRYKPLPFDLRSGDGVVLNNNERGVVLGPVLNGTANITKSPFDNPKDIIGALVKTKKVEKQLLLANEFRKETFGEYLTRPTGFGKSKWPWFIACQLFCLAIIGYGIVSWKDNGWVGVVMALSVEVVLMLGTYMNFKHKWV